MPKINVFKDVDGDLLVTTADKVEPGITAFQINGERVSAADVVSELRDMPRIILVMQAGRLANTAEVAALIARLQPTLVHSVNVDEDDEVYEVLAA
ncbi:hypothetical protein [Pantoea phage LIMEzero]|uniref:Uncharacterized protein n=1 Tax=Pantoea phage LIMEzero TaxID=943335 RepID=F4N9R1_9CAUD|nr:hypothetical protein LIMEzero_ORF08 [Pantoea phage LIMEzero]CBY88539.1 hypothetical protein [Pantoea phage LIMEzero]